MKDALLDTIVHPTAALFPLLDGPAFDELVDDIRYRGQLMPCVRHEGKLIDGRNRWRACRVAKVEPVETDWKPVPGVTVSEWIVSTNAIRRHMTIDQLNVVTAEAMKYIKEERAAARAATQFKGKTKDGAPLRADGSSVPQKSGEPNEPAKARDSKAEHARSTAGAVAAVTGSSRYAAEQAVSLVAAAEKSPEAAEAVEQVKSGKVKLGDAVKVVKATTPSKKPAKRKAKTPLEKFTAAAEAAWKDCPAAARSKLSDTLHKIIDDLSR